MQESVIYRQIFAEGEAKGEAKGESKKAQEIAQNLLQKGLNLDLIAEVTKLPLDILQSWQNQLNQQQNN